MACAPIMARQAIAKHTVRGERIVADATFGRRPSEGKTLCVYVLQTELGMEPPSSLIDAPKPVSSPSSLRSTEVWREWRRKVSHAAYGCISFVLDQPRANNPCLITYGGVTSAGQSTDALQAIDFTSSTESDAQPIAIELSTDSDKLPSISFHSAVVHPPEYAADGSETQVFIFGGRTNGYSRDVYQLRFPYVVKSTTRIWFYNCQGFLTLSDFQLCECLTVLFSFDETGLVSTPNAIKLT
jgi:hypothetical protein